jgi:acyl-CoA dehydrogenase
MADVSFLRWPFFDDTHRALHWALSHWRLPDSDDAEPADVDAASRRLVRQLGDDGWLRHVVPARYGGLHDAFDVRSLCLVREMLAYRSGLADFAFAMQGLGTGSITLFGSDELKQRYLPPVARGEAIAAFAISEAEAGSDVSAMQTTARADGDGWVIDGEKTWISNAGIADHYVVFCRMPDLGERGYGAFVIDADTPGLSVSERIRVIAPHVLGTLRFERCRVPGSALIGQAGAGLKIALATLDVFRTTVAAAALGFARRAFDEAVRFTQARRGFGKPIAEMQMTQARIADMAVAVDAAALLIYRAAWARDTGEPRITREAAMAKLFATESAQRVIDDAVQLHGGRGVVHGEVVERLYREIRALRIYEGTSEIQKIVIASQVYAGATHA